MSSADYRRTPLPPDARPRTGWLALCFMVLIASPFMGFAWHGKVDERGLVTGLCIATIAVLGLVVLMVKRWLAWRRLPSDIKDQWRTGRLVPSEGAPPVIPPARFAHQKNLIEVRTAGLLVSRHTVLGVHGTTTALETMWVADQAGQLFVPWQDIVEWAVDTDSDGPDHHVLQLKDAGQLRLRRFTPQGASEPDVLDAVRSIGGLGIRLRADVL